MSTDLDHDLAGEAAARRYDAEVERLLAQVERLRAALTTFGWHVFEIGNGFGQPPTWYCPAWSDPTQECDDERCGYDKAMTALAAEPAARASIEAPWEERAHKWHRMAIAASEALRDVRNVDLTVDGSPCWCPDWLQGPAHTPACDRAKALLQQPEGEP